MIYIILNNQNYVIVKIPGYALQSVLDLQDHLFGGRITRQGENIVLLCPYCWH